MSTRQTVTIEPIPGREAEGEVVGTVPRPNRPSPMLRVDVDGSTWRVPEEEVDR